MRISDWSSDVCSSDLIHPCFPFAGTLETPHRWAGKNPELGQWIAETRLKLIRGEVIDLSDPRINYRESNDAFDMGTLFEGIDGKDGSFAAIHRSEEHTSELQSLMRIPYAVFFLHKKKHKSPIQHPLT